MSEVKVNKISPRSGTTVTLGDSGDTFTIPSGATINNQGTATNFGATGSASWVTTPKTGDFTAVAGEGYFVNTTSGAITVTLPASPAAGAVVAVADYANTFQTNNLTLGRNSSNIEGDAADFVINQRGISITLVYVDATKGWITTDTGNSSNAFVNDYVEATGGTITCSGDYRIHTFTGPGTFCVTSGGTPSGSTLVDYLVVAGGGGGGSGDGGGGGGGAGGFRESPGTASGSYTVSPLGAAPAVALPVLIQPYTITVGAGGNGAGGAIPAPSAGTNGGVSTFSTITSVGGGAGGNFGGGNPFTCAAGRNGSSGGGGSSRNNPSTNAAGGSGNTPPVSPPQGQNGGAGAGNTGGGGGGAGGTGQAAPGPTQGGNGGVGAGTAINPAVGTPGPNGALRYFAGGGGGNNETPGTAPVQGTGGYGGGAAGDAPGSSGNAGTANTGGAGGGMDTNPLHPTATHNGGSGIVIIRYKFQN